MTWRFLTTTLICIAATLSLVAQQGMEYRTITQIDGSVHRGIVVGSDADALYLETSHGQIAIPIEEVMEVESLSREQFLAAEGRRIVYLGLQSPKESLATAREIDAIMLQALQRDQLLITAAEDLEEEPRRALLACEDLECKLGILRAENVWVVYGSIKPARERYQVIFHRLDRNMNHMRDVAIMLADPQGEQDRLQRAAALVLGEKPASDDPDLEMVGRKEIERQELEARARTEAQQERAQARVAKKQAKAQAKAERERRRQDRAQAREAGSSVVSPELAQARRLDLMPIPGASSYLHYGNLPIAMASTGVVLGISSTVVFLMGDTRRLGTQNGLSVPWTYEQRLSRNAVFLSGAGVLTYVASTLLINQIVRRINERRGTAGQSHRTHRKDLTAQRRWVWNGYSFPK